MSKEGYIVGYIAGWVLGLFVCSLYGKPSLAYFCIGAAWQTIIVLIVIYVEYKKCQR